MALPYRADHIGSLLRPPSLLAARSARAEGRLGAEELARIEDRAIRDIVALQREVGLDIVTDGEYRRDGWMTRFWEAVEGFVRQRGFRNTVGPEGRQVTEVLRQVVGGKLRKTRRISGEESAFLKAHAGAPYKITVPNALVYTMSGYAPGVTDKVYASRAALAQDLAGIIRGELQELVAEGVPYIQIDAPIYMQLADATHRELLKSEGWDPNQALDDAIAADQACLAGIRGAGRTLGFHLCRGNVRGRWLAEGSYDPIAERLFNAFDVDRLLLEYDSDRAGSFAPLRFVPKQVTVVLGLVTTKEARLESQDDLLRRIEEAARYVPVERLALSPQCGFATQAAGNPLSFDDQRRKLELIVNTARKVWPQAA